MSVEQFIKTVPLFKSLSDEERKVIANSMELKTFGEGQTLFRQGDQGDAFYIVSAGQCNVMVRPSGFLKAGDEVRLINELTFAGTAVPPGTLAKVDKYDPSRDYPYTVRVHGTGQRGRVLPEEIEPISGMPEDKFVAKLKPGDYFGEQSLLKGAPRNATIVAASELKLAVLDAKKFKELRLGEKLSFAKRKAIQTFDAQTDMTGKDTSKSEDDMNLIASAVAANKKLCEIVQLEKSQISNLVASAWKRDCNPGDVIIQQGDIQANEFYVVKSGEYQVTVSETGGMEDKSTAAQVVGSIKAGGTFGELALLYQAPRAATVTCSSKGTLFVIDRYTFKEVLKAASQGRINEFMKILGQIKLFDCLLSDEKESLANALVETQFIKGEVIIKEGEVGDAFYILARGQIEFSKNGHAISIMDSSKPEKGSFFGERSLLKKEPRAATATVISDEATALALTKARFEELLGSLEDMIKEFNSNNNKRQSRIHNTGPAKRAMDTIKMADLKRLGLLGCGGFGAVTLEQHKETGKTYALKKLSKGFIVKTKMQQGVKREKEILSMCDSDFVIKLYATFKDPGHLYFLLEPALGGELYATYHKHRFHGDVKKAKFYSACVVYCFEHLHSRNILYRDLKPENLLLDDKGQCKITDMGLAKVVVGKTYTTCGTPDYFAPEVIQQTGMGKGVDWWTLGVLIHELMCGHAPFEANDPMETYQKIVRGVNRVRFTYKDNDAIDLVKNMLKHQPSERLPMRVGGTKNIKGHPWYAGFDWDTLFSRTMDAPYKPNVKGPTDISNFRAHESDLPPDIPYKDDGSGWDADF